LGIVRFALKYTHTFYVVAALILFLGVTAVVEMPTDIFPEIDIPVVSVIWQFTGLNTTEMEQRFTTYSQYAISSNVNGIKDIEAETVDGISVQKLHFQPDVNLSLAISTNETASVTASTRTRSSSLAAISADSARSNAESIAEIFTGAKLNRRKRVLEVDCRPIRRSDQRSPEACTAAIWRCGEFSPRGPSSFLGLLSPAIRLRSCNATISLLAIVPAYRGWTSRRRKSRSSCL
jgi:hypothetical protein